MNIFSYDATRSHYKYIIRQDGVDCRCKTSELEELAVSSLTSKPIFLDFDRLGNKISILMASNWWGFGYINTNSLHFHSQLYLIQYSSYSRVTIKWGLNWTVTLNVSMFPGEGRLWVVSWQYLLLVWVCRYESNISISVYTWNSKAQ